MKFVTICILAALLSACATAQPIRWDKPGTTREQFAQDEAGCEMEAYKARASCAYPGTPLAEQLQQRVYESCMRSKGYSAIPR